MRAFAIDGFDEPGSVRQLAPPQLEAGEVLLGVRAAGVNAVDPWVVKGALKDMMEHRFPLIPGIDASGTIEAVGPGVEGFAAGDEVYGIADKPFFGAGTFAELVALPATAIARKPASVDQVAAAALPHAALTALAGLEAVDPSEGQVVLVVGATGGVGSYLTQLVARRGARVVAVARGENADYAQSMGASETIDYTTGGLVEIVHSRYPEGIDAVVDLHGDRPILDGLSGLVRAGGKVVSTAGAADSEAMAERGLQGGNINRASPELLNELSRLVDEGQLRLPTTRVYSLEETGDALDEIAGQHVRGKLLISVAGP